MKFSYEFSNLCGSSYQGGNVLFSKDGNSILSPVGNRISQFDLVHHKCSTFPFENQNNITRIALSPCGSKLISIDQDGYALLINYHKRVIVNKFKFKGPVLDMKFSPDGRYLAVTKGKHCDVWMAPALLCQYSPFTLYRTYTGHYDHITHINWSNDSQFLFTCSLDMSVKMFSLDPIPGFRPLTLAGHRSRTIASFTDHTDTLYTLAEDGALFVWSFAVDEDGQVAAGNSLASGHFAIEKKHFLAKDHARTESAAFHQVGDLNLVVVGFSSGLFSLYSLPDILEIHSLSISNQQISTVAISPTGDWLGFGSSTLGQLLVWEWQSETYILKQQGHSNDINAVAYSTDGQIMCTGADDGKVKIWNSSSGFCFATFADHAGPITAIEFTSAGNVVISSSLDGTVRAYDLVRYRNFRTLVSPTTCQFISLAIDPSGEIICAGAMDPFDIFVWSLQTGRLLDVLSGHEGPVCSLAFSDEQSMLASCSWDKTAKLWDVFERKASVDNMVHGSDVLAVAFRSDGNELCTSSLDGQLYFWDINSNTLKGTIECREDIRGGRRRNDPRSAENSTQGISFRSICYSADNRYILAGGDSKFICIYDVDARVLVSRYQISCNRSLDGVVDQLNSRRMTDAGPVDDIDASDSDHDDLQTRLAKRDHLPGVCRGQLSSRRVIPSIRCRAVRFSPTGRSWVAAATQGLLIYSLDQELLFDPVDLDVDITPATIASTFRSGELSKALVMALRLNEHAILETILVTIPADDVALIVRSIPLVFLERMLNLIADGLETRSELEIYLVWVVNLLTIHGTYLKRNSHHMLTAFRSLQKNMGAAFANLSSLCNSNQYQLEYLIAKIARQDMIAAPSPTPPADDQYRIAA